MLLCVWQFVLQRQRCKEMEFFLKWKGYPESENSWEPLTNLNCHELLKHYMLEHKLPLSNDLTKSKRPTSPPGKQAQKPGQIPAANQRKSRKVEAAKETRFVKKQPVKIKLPRKRQPTTLLNTKGGTAKRIKIINRKSKATQKMSTPGCGEDDSIASNEIQKTVVASANEVVSGLGHIRTQALATPASESTSSARDQNPRCHIAAFDKMKPITSDDRDSDSDSDVIITCVDPPPDHQPVTPQALLSVSPNPNLNRTLSPTDLYFSFMRFPRHIQALPTSVPPAPISTIQTSPGGDLHTSINQGLQRADSNGSLSQSGTPSTSAIVTGASPSSSPLLSSPLSENSFKLQLSPSGSSAGECESPCKSSLRGAPPSQSPLTCSSYIGVLTALSSGSGNLPTTKFHRVHKNATRSLLSSKGNKKRLNGNHIKSGQTCSKADRRGRMGPVPRPCQPVHSQSTSLQTKAAKKANDTSNESAAVQSHPSNIPSDDHMSVIFKFSGMCTQYVVHKRTLCAGSDDSDTDCSTKETNHLPARKQVKMTHTSILSSTTNLRTTSTETGKKAAVHHRPNGILKNGLHKLHNGIDKANENLSTNELNIPVCGDSAASCSNSGSLTCIQSLPKSSSDEVSSELLPSNLSSMESVKYKQILLDWQFQLNSQRGGTDDIIFVENDIDTAEPPKDFTYICSNMYDRGVPDPNLPQVRDSLCGCQCYHLGKRCGPKAPYCCSIMADVPFAYTLAGKVCVTPGTPIYECNWKCSCPMDCSNRVVQHGRKIPLCIFRTNNRGWGVKTLQPIKANTFVTEYVGEVITSDEAEKRGKAYDEEGETYLFDLDFDDDQMFTIDAKNYGNISHFFNHSVSAITSSNSS
jgi:histone-lysine N-methyltransferase SUV39H